MLAGKPTMTTCLNVISCSMNYCSSFPLISAAHRHSAQPAHSRVSVSPSLQGTTTHNAFQCFPSHPLSLFFSFLFSFYYLLVVLLWDYNQQSSVSILTTGLHHLMFHQCTETGYSIG